MLGASGGLQYSELMSETDTTDYTSLTGESQFDVPYVNDAPFNDDFTISLWFKTNDGRQNRPNGTAFNRYFWGIGGGEDEAGKLSTAWGGVTPAGKLHYTYISNVADVDLLSLPGMISGDTDSAVFADGAVDWTHLAWVFTGGNGSDTTITMYVDGSAVAASHQDPFNQCTSANHDGFKANNLGLVIGGGISSQGTVIEGKGIHSTEFIDDFALHSAALDADAVAAVYNSGTPINLLANSGNYDNSGDVVLYYKFNGKFDGDALLDSHGTQNATANTGTQFSTESAT